MEDNVLLRRYSGGQSVSSAERYDAMVTLDLKNGFHHYSYSQNKPGLSGFSVQEKIVQVDSFTVWSETQSMCFARQFGVYLLTSGQKAYVSLHTWTIFG